MAELPRVAVADQLRLFVAIDPPGPVRAALHVLPRPLRGVAWTPPHQYHLTLRFIGEVEAERVTVIEAGLAAIRVESFIVPVEAVGSFPPRRPPRVLWAGIGNGHPRLFQLRQRVDDALLACALDLDVRTFHPHFTLGRCGPGTSVGAVAAFLHEHRDFVAPPFRVEAFTLYRSDRHAAGVVHTAVRRFDLLSGGQS